MAKTSMKIVPGVARKPEDVKRIFEAARERAQARGRQTEKSKMFSGFIEEIFEYAEISEVDKNTLVEYIQEATGNFEDRKKLIMSINGFLKSKAGQEKFVVDNGIITRNYRG